MKFGRARGALDSLRWQRATNLSNRVSGMSDHSAIRSIAWVEFKPDWRKWTDWTVIVLTSNSITQICPCLILRGPHSNELTWVEPQSLVKKLIFRLFRRKRHCNCGQLVRLKIDLIRERGANFDESTAQTVITQES